MTPDKEKNLNLKIMTAIPFALEHTAQIYPSAGKILGIKTGTSPERRSLKGLRV
jgi:hypothetical protein